MNRTFHTTQKRLLVKETTLEPTWVRSNYVHRYGIEDLVKTYGAKLVTVFTRTRHIVIYEAKIVGGGEIKLREAMSVPRCTGR